MRPAREVATNNGQTYFVTSNTVSRQPFFRHERWARLFVEVLLSYRPSRFLVHEFTVMPDHFHVLMTPSASLERAVQCVKGGFSFRAGRELAWRDAVWAAGFSDHRIRDGDDFESHCRYIKLNPVKRGLVTHAGEYAFCSASGMFLLDPCPQGLKPKLVAGGGGAAKAAPFQSNGEELSWVEASAFHGNGEDRGGAKVSAFASNGEGEGDRSSAVRARAERKEDGD